MGEKKVLVISGPTGVGENTIAEELMRRYSSFARLVTATTRKPRSGEQEGVTYYFMSNDQFEGEIEKGNVPEYQNSRDNNIYYGTYLPDLEKKKKEGRNVIVMTDITGTRYFKKDHNATTIFILPDSMENLKKRHIHRTPDITEEDLSKRLEYAQREIDEEADFYDFKVINAQDKMEEAVDEIITILKKEGYQL